MSHSPLYKLLDRLPQNLLSRSFGVVSDIELPKTLQSVVNKGFARFADIDTSESEFSPDEYHSLNQFFTRRLAEDARTIEVDPDRRFSSVVSPCDGRLEQFGEITEGELIQAKGKKYTVRALLDSYGHAVDFERGSYATIYLSPKNYHRVHAAVEGVVSEVSYIPGRLWPVKPWAVENIEELFAENERLVTYIETENFGRVATVMVGATCVGRMTLTFGDFETNGSFRRRDDTPLQKEVYIKVGDELGCFNLGSTVILLFEKKVDFQSEWRSGSTILLGNQLANI